MKKKKKPQYPTLISRSGMTLLCPASRHISFSGQISEQVVLLYFDVVCMYIHIRYSKLLVINFTRVVLLFIVRDEHPTCHFVHMTCDETIVIFARQNE